MTHRKAKRFINASNDWLVFASEEKEHNTKFSVLLSREEAWEILLNLAVREYPIRETLRNILKAADDYIENNGTERES